MKNTFVKSKSLKVIGLALLTGIVAVSFNASSSVFAVTTPTQTAEQKKAAQTARIAEYKTKQKLTLTTSEQTKLKGSCKAAQAKLTALTTKYQTANTARTKVYSTVSRKITAITTDLKGSDVDTAAIEASQKKLTEAIDAYKTAYDTLAAGVADSSELDCVTDSVAFKSALVTVRADQIVVVEKAKAIPEAIVGVQKALAEAKQALTTDQEAN